MESRFPSPAGHPTISIRRKQKIAPERSKPENLFALAARQSRSEVLPHEEEGLNRDFIFVAIPQDKVSLFELVGQGALSDGIEAPVPDIPSQRRVQKLRINLIGGINHPGSPETGRATPLRLADLGLRPKHQRRNQFNAHDNITPRMSAKVLRHARAFLEELQSCHTAGVLPL